MGGGKGTPAIWPKKGSLGDWRRLTADPPPPGHTLTLKQQPVWQTGTSVKFVRPVMSVGGALCGTSGQGFMGTTVVKGGGRAVVDPLP